MRIYARPQVLTAKPLFRYPAYDNFCVYFGCVLQRSMNAKIKAHKTDDNHAVDDLSVEMYFSTEEWSKTSDYEKKRLQNLKSKYLTMTSMGIDLTR